MKSKFIESQILKVNENTASLQKIYAESWTYVL